MNHALVSIIVPVYQVEPYLNKCVDSLLAQTYEHLEIILVDDGSPDKSGEICDRYQTLDARVRVIHKANGGLSDARNAGIDVATGDYLMFVDSDDYLEPQAVEHLMRIAGDTGCDIAHMKSHIVDKDYQIVHTQTDNSLRVSVVSSHEYVQGMCQKTRSESVCDKMFAKQLFDGRRFEVGRLNEDFFFLSQLLFEDLEIGIIEFAGYNYYQRYGSISRGGFGQSIVDAVQNTHELIQIARVQVPDLIPHLTRLLLFQMRTALITMPWVYVRDKSPVYSHLMELLRLYVGNIRSTNLALKDKLFLKAVNKMPRVTLRIVSGLWAAKKQTDTKRPIYVPPVK